MYERFTDRARKAMQLANQEAQRLNHSHLGTEHLLLGLLKEGAGIAAQALKNLDLDLRLLRREVENFLKAEPDRSFLGQLPQSPLTKNALAFALEESENLGHGYVGTEHLLLGILRESKGLGAKVFMNLGLGLKEIRDEILFLLDVAKLKGEATSQSRVWSVFGEKLQEFPPEVALSLFELNAAIARWTQDKEAVIAAQDFEQAAILRDQADKLHQQRETFWRDWIAHYPLDPALRKWNGGTVRRMALAIGASKDWNLLPIFGEILQAAGCQDAALLEHCRQPGEHLNQCWVLDLVLHQNRV